MDRAHLAMEAWVVTVIAVLAAASVSAMAPASLIPRGRLSKVPKVYNALITSDIPLLPSRAETAATAAVGPVFLYSTNLPVLLQPQAVGTTPQNHLEKLTQLQNQLQREEADQQSQLQIQSYQQQLLVERQQPEHTSQPVQQQLFPERQWPVQQSHPPKQQPVQQQLFPERQLPVQRPYPPKQLPVQQQWFPERQLPEQRPYPPKQLPVQQQLFPERHLPVQQPYPPKQLPVQQQLYPERQLPVQEPYPAKQLPVQQQLYHERQLPVQQPRFPEHPQLASSQQQPLQVQQVPVQHLGTDELSAQQPTRQFDIPYQQKPIPQQYPQTDPQLQQKQIQLQHQKQLNLQVQQQKQLQLSQFINQQKTEQDTSYLPMPEMNFYQPPPSVHIDDIKNNKPSNVAIPDVPPPPLPVGKRLQSYSYNSPGLSPPPPTNHHVPYG